MAKWWEHESKGGEPTPEPGGWEERWARIKDWRPKPTTLPPRAQLGYPMTPMPPTDLRQIPGQQTLLPPPRIGGATPVPRAEQLLPPSESMTPLPQKFFTRPEMPAVPGGLYERLQGRSTGAMGSPEEQYAKLPDWAKGKYDRWRPFTKIAELTWESSLKRLEEGYWRPVRQARAGPTEPPSGQEFIDRQLEEAEKLAALIPRTQGAERESVEELMRGYPPGMAEPEIAALKGGVKSVGLTLEYAGELWRWMTRGEEIKIPTGREGKPLGLGVNPFRAIEQAGGGMFEVIQLFAYVPKVLMASAQIGNMPAAAGMDPEAWFPLAQVPYSWLAETSPMLQAIQAGDTDRLASLMQTGMDFKAKPLMGEGAREYLAGELEAIKAGEKTGVEAAEQIYDWRWEVVGEAIFDALIFWDIAALGLGAQKMIQADLAMSKVARAVTKDPRAMREIGRTLGVMAKLGDETALDIRRGLGIIGEPADPNFLQKIRDWFTWPVELLPESKVQRDVTQSWMALSGPLSTIDETEDALRLLETWAFAPEQLTELGALVSSPAGVRARMNLAHFWEAVKELVSLNPEVPYNAGRLMTELEQIFLAGLNVVYGVTPPNRYVSFTNKWRGFQSELYLSGVFNPGYVSRNVFSEWTNIVFDGANPLMKREHIVEFFEEFGIAPRRMEKRTLGAMGETFTGVGERGSRLPTKVLRTLSDKGREIAAHGEPLGRFPIGEEPRYVRILTQKTMEFLQENWPRMIDDSFKALPGGVVDNIGPVPIDDLRRGLADKWSQKGQQQFLARWMRNSRPADRISVTKYLNREELGAVSPKLRQMVDDELAKIGPRATPAEVDDAFRRLAHDVFDDEAEKLSKLEALPKRSVASDIEGEELAEAIGINLDEIAERLDDDELRKRAAQIQQDMAGVEEEVKAARTTMVETGKGAKPDPRTLDIFIWANRDVMEMRSATYAAVKKILENAKELYRKHKKDPIRSAEIWTEAFGGVADEWGKLAAKRRDTYTLGGAYIRHAQRGGSVTEALGMTPSQLAEQLLAFGSEVRELPEGPVGYLVGSVLDATEDTKFWKFVNRRRAIVDRASTEAHRYAITSPPEMYGDVIDLLDSAGYDVETLGRQAAHQVAEARKKAFRDSEAAYARHKGGKLAKPAAQAVWEKYYIARNDIWNKYFKNAEQRWDIARRDIATRNISTKPPPDGWKSRVGHEFTEDERDTILNGFRLPENKWHTLPDNQRQLMWEFLGEDIPGFQMRLPDPNDLPLSSELPEGWRKVEVAEEVEEVADAAKVTPEPPPPPPPGPATRDEFFQSMNEAMTWPREQQQAAESLLDGMARVWARDKGSTPESWYKRYLAGYKRSRPDYYSHLQGLMQMAPTEGAQMRFRRAYDRLGGILQQRAPAQRDNIMAVVLQGKWARLRTDKQFIGILDLENIDDYSAVYEYANSAAAMEWLRRQKAGQFETYADMQRAFIGKPVKFDPQDALAWDYVFGQGPLSAEDTEAFKVWMDRSANMEQQALSQFLYQQSSPLWWRKIERFVMDKVPNKVTGDELGKMLDKAVKSGAVAADELQWTRIEGKTIAEWAKAQPGRLSKRELLERVQEGRVRITETVGGGGEAEFAKIQEEAGRVMVETDAAYEELRTILRRPENEAGLVRVLPVADERVADPVTRALFEYRMQASGGTALRPAGAELIERLAPEEATRLRGLLEDQARLEARMGEAQRTMRTRWSQYTQPGGRQYREMRFAYPDAAEPMHFEAWYAKQRGRYKSRAEARAFYDEVVADPSVRIGPQFEPYRSPHWAGEENVLAHARYDIRDGWGGGTNLHVAEAQSDLHQLGRRIGYQGDEAKIPDGWWVEQEGPPGQWIVRDAQNNAVHSFFNKVATTEEQARTVLLSDLRAGKVQLARRPPPLPFKGTQAWTRLVYRRMLQEAAGKADSLSWTTGKTQAQRYVQQLRVSDAGLSRFDWDAWDILARLEDELSPQDFKRVKGLLSYYDQITPGVVRKLVKPYGLEVRKGLVRVGRELDTLDARYLESVTSGLEIRGLPPAVRGWSSADLKYTVLELGDGRAVSFRPGGAGMREYASVEDAIGSIRGSMGFEEAWVVDIKPGTKFDFALFQGEPPRGALEWLDDGRAFYHMFEAADFDTFIHETGHLLRRMLSEDELHSVARWSGLDNGDSWKFMSKHHAEYKHYLRLKADKALTAADAKRMKFIKPNALMYEAAEEKFANAFVKYFYEGVAPDPELQPIFDKIVDWLKEIYKQIVGSQIDVEIDDSLRGIFDRKIALDPKPRAGDPMMVGLDVGKYDVHELQNIWQNRLPVSAQDAAQLHGTGDDWDGLAEILYREWEPIDELTTVKKMKQKLVNDAYYMETEAVDEVVLRPRRRPGVDPEMVEEITGDLRPTKIGYRKGAARRKYQRYEIYLGWADGSIPDKKTYDAIPAKQKREARIAFHAEQKERADWLQAISEDAMTLGKGETPAPRDVPEWVSERMIAALDEIEKSGFDAEDILTQRRNKPGRKPRQMDMFEETMEDMPLFSATAPKGEVEEFVPPPAARQEVLPGMERTEEEMRAAALGPPPTEAPIEELPMFGGPLEEAPALGPPPEEGMLPGMPRRAAIQRPEPPLDWSRLRPDAEAEYRAWAQRMKEKYGESYVAQISPEEHEELQRIFELGKPPGPTPNDQISLFQRAAHNAATGKKGAGEPDFIRMVREDSKATMGSLNKVHSGVRRDWQAWQPVAADAQTRKAVTDWYRTEIMPKWSEMRATAAQYGEEAADFALINYENRRGFDYGLSLIAPYHYWYTRAGHNWAKRFMLRPGLLALYVRAREAMRKANQEAGRRQRFEQMIKIPFPWLPDDMGDALYVDPVSLMLPMSNFVDFDWMDDAESKTGLARIARGLQAYGVRPYHFLEFPFKMGWLADAGQWFGMDEATAQQKLGPSYKGDYPYLLPMTGLIKAGTAAARGAGGDEGWIPPGGVVIEEPFRRAVGLPRSELWDPYRVTRYLAGMAAQDATNWELARHIEIAQALVQADQDQEKGYGRIWEPDSDLVQQLQAEYNWSDDDVSTAQGLVVDAMQGAAKESGIRAIGRFTGPRLAVETTGERAQLELAEEARGMTWNWEQLEGTYANYAQFKRDYPARYPYSTQYATLPGEPKYSTMSPGDRANWMAQRKEKDHIISSYADEIDALLEAKPWDTDAIREVKAERKEALESIEAQYPMLEDLDKLPAILYGMSPDEMWTSVVEAELDALEEGLPSAETFKTPEGEIDWAGYYRARDAWEAALPELPTILAGDYKGMSTLDALHAKWNQGHSIREALAYTYDRRVAQPAWDKRRKLIEGGISKGAAWDRSVGKVGAMTGEDLIPLIQKEYQRRWSDEELYAEIGTTRLPALQNQGGPERQMESEFWDLQAQVPGMAPVRDDPAIQIILNPATRDTATPEQVERARDLLARYLRKNPAAPLAKQESKMLHDKGERRWPGIFEIESSYFDLEKDARASFLDLHPELKLLWDFRQEFREKHPAYNRYYPKRSGGTSGTRYEPYWTEERLQEYDKRFEEGGWRGVFGTPWQERRGLRPPP